MRSVGRINEQLEHSDHVAVWGKTGSRYLPFLFTILSLGYLMMGCQQGQHQASHARPTPKVSTVTIQTQSVHLETELPGRTTAYRIAEIRPQVSGLILKRLFEEGAQIEAGQVLYEIDSTPFESALNNAKAALGRAEANLPSLKSRVERYRDLLADKAVSQQDFDDANAALNQVEADVQYWKANVKTAEINLDYTQIKAPISGRIGKSNVTVGGIVTAYQPTSLATIQQMDPIYVDVPQSTTELLRLKNHLKQGQITIDPEQRNKVKLYLEDGTPYPLDATLQFSDVTVEPTTGSVILRILAPNPDGILLPGMFVRAMIQEGTKEDAVLIPQQAISRDPKGNPFALTVEADNKVGYRPLGLDRAIGGTWLVTSGLKPGDQVITEGLLMLRPGTVVEATPQGSMQASPKAAPTGEKGTPKKPEGAN